MSSSPWRRGAPQVVFSATIRKINCRTCFGVCLLPIGFFTFEISLQYRRKPALTYAKHCPEFRPALGLPPVKAKAAKETKIGGPEFYLTTINEGMALNSGTHNYAQPLRVTAKVREQNLPGARLVERISSQPPKMSSQAWRAFPLNPNARLHSAWRSYGERRLSNATGLAVWHTINLRAVYTDVQPSDN